VSREALAQAIQSTAADDEDLEGAILVGWVTIAEFVGGDGQRWLSRMAGDVRGQVPPTWTLKGWLTDSLDDLAHVVYISDTDDEDDDE
jgi:hypothetical protein